ncbi:hypothetical protein [Dolichospermum heterosporum]|uniref:Uncharacterized protein n=1 Tax=Dolichospermum heterosporum TAC447 TaxID=747523 RepID=A0ABY5LUD2_9CYAN|nr:hypothetical protein [Dolichospermum heterosporum]UUO14357.1 hypothetical protein NG743_20290 [Dolichospermum heterosporum TAC447]
MFEYVIALEVPTVPRDENLEEGEYCLQEIAKYEFDLGLRVGDKIIVNWKLGDPSDKVFSFQALVKRRLLKVIPSINSHDKDRFRVQIEIEAIEKEHIARVADIMKRLNPDSFKD